jgi:hypothetical protein
MEENMNISLLFRKRTALTEDGFPWLDVGEVHAYPARRNPTGVARVSAILVRALAACMEGNVLEARSERDNIAALVKSRSTSGASWCMWFEGSFLIPHGSSDKITYHVGVLSLLRAVQNPSAARDLLESYLTLLEK